MTKEYYECHVTMVSNHPAKVRAIVTALKWRFSMIDGDANLGDGVKMYATRQVNAKVPRDKVLADLHRMAEALAVVPYIEVVRRKVETVWYDDRIDKVCTDNCAACGA